MLAGVYLKDFEHTQCNTQAAVGLVTLPVLVTPTGSELALPQELGFPAGSTWRLAECWATCFFVALATADSFKSLDPRTLILCWDSDLVHFLESSTMSMKLHALQHVRTERREDHPWRLSVREVSEIWLGVDRAADDIEVIVFKAKDGSSFCGTEGVPVPPSVRIDRLVSSIPAAASATNLRASS